MKSLPTIQTPRLLLRPCTKGDIEPLYRIWLDQDMRRYLWDNRPISYQEAEETVEEYLKTEVEDRLGIWCIHSIEARSALIGFCGLRFIAGTSDVELLYGLLPAYWKRGFATEASRALLRYSFNTLDVPHVYAGSDPVNLASFGVMERLGMYPVAENTVPVPGALYYRMERSQFHD